VKKVSVGNRILLARKRAGVSQSKLAEAIGIDANTISRWERDAVKMKAEKMAIVASSLNTSVAYLLGETDDPKRYTTLLGGDHDGATGNPPMHDEFTDAREAVGLSRVLNETAGKKVSMTAGQNAPNKGFVFERTNKNGEVTRIEFSADTPESVVRAAIAEVMKTSDEKTHAIYKPAVNGDISRFTNE
jgi:transcriptional regulator with XRE-family HTH domain